MARLIDPEKKRALRARLARVEGQLRGIQSMLDAEADCEKLAQQLSASRKALDKAFFTMVACAIEQGDLPADHVADMLAKYA
jgi:CsoR family transcriptional regulator, copper-sensing transcriptional repressor